MSSKSLSTRPSVVGAIRTRVTFRILHRALGHALLLVSALILLAPVIWTVSTSLRTPAQSFTVPPQWIPLHPDFVNYRAVFDSIPFWHYALNSAIVCVSIVVGQLLTSALAGYAFARFRFPGRTVLFWLIMATIMIPLQATIIPIFIVVSKLGLGDKLAALIVPSWVTPFGIFLMRQTFMTLSHEYGEAAVLDGANALQVFWRIYLPMATTSLLVLAILAFNYHWNEFFRPLIFLSSLANFTLPLGLYTLFGYMGTGSVSVVLAGVVLSVLVVLIIYLFGQRYLIEGLSRGGIKG